MADDKSPHSIERDIERERAAFSSTLNEIQDRFSPEHLAGELYRGFREHGGDIGKSFGRSVKDNPVALTLTGIGLAWMMFGSSQREPRWPERDRGRYSVSRRERFDRQDLYPEDYGYGTGDASRRRYGYAGEDNRYSSRVSRRPGTTYPIWADVDLDDDDLYDDDGSTGSSYSTATGKAKSYADQAGSAARTARDQGKAWADDVSGSVRGAGERIGAAARSAGDSARRASSDAMSSASRAASAVQDRSSRLYKRLSEGTENLSHEAQDRIVSARYAAVDAYNRSERFARQTYREGVDAASDFYKDQPLVVGALAVAVGAAIASALPRTRQEDEWMGHESDALMDEAEAIYREERDKISRVADAVQKKGETIVREKTDRAKNAMPDTKSTVDKVADEVSDAVHRVSETAKTEARKEDVGNPSRS